MISAGQWKAYNDAVATITDRAKGAVTVEMQAWLLTHENASYEEVRKEAERILAAQADIYSQATATLAADWYDAQGKEAGAALDRAITSSADDPGSLAKTVRYQMGKYIAGDTNGFCVALGEWAENQAKRALNQTIMANAKRDRRNGVKFARITSGRNACGFCLMLAGRGAVYHSRKTAGEFDRWHKHCSCKIVPSYSEDKYEVLVDGHDPKKAESAWRHYKALKESGLPKAQCDALLAAYLDANNIGVPLSNDDELAYANALGDGMKSAWNSFIKKRSPDEYESTVEKFVKLLGDEYGSTWSCKSIRNVSGTVIYAHPSQDELWVACKITKDEKKLTFLASDQNYMPDLRTASGYAEIKCPLSANKVSARLRHAKVQLDAQPGGDKVTYLGLHKVDDIERARAIASDMQLAGSAINVKCVLPSGEIVNP